MAPWVKALATKAWPLEINSWVSHGEEKGLLKAFL